jgi:hypothetical protein
MYLGTCRSFKVGFAKTLSATVPEGPQFYQIFKSANLRICSLVNRPPLAKIYKTTLSFVRIF